MKNVDDRSVIGFAAEELNKYARLLKIETEVKLGLFEDFGLSVELEDPFFDDAFKMLVKNRTGYIAGSNGRSVLFGVYRLLEEWGVGWVRPGKNGTYIPDSATEKDLDLLEIADKRHRTMCIEGAVSIENVLDMIEWIPKRYFNSYYIQFNDSFIFFDRWYGHRRNPQKKAEPFGYDAALEYVDKMAFEIKKRGLLLQRMGHGWTCDPFGIPGHGWDVLDPNTIPQEYKDICAVVNGKREVWKNIPIATQLCYSNPFVANTIAKGVVKYVEEHPETDVIHFWLGDYFNNTCECENCTKLRYSDYYVRMINIVTSQLKANGVKKKLAFSCGYNKGWIPIDTQIADPEMLVLTFAPISRTFGETFPSSFRITEVPEYEVNKFSNPRSVDENLAFLHGWEQYYQGDTIDFDYHLMWDHILDAGGEGIARVIHEDIKNFKNLGMNGFISCQLQRNSFPTAIAMTVMGKTLWSDKTNFEAVKRRLYADAFGEENAEMMCDYFATVSKGFSIGAIRSQVEVDRAHFRKDVEAAVIAMEQMGDTIAENLAQKSPCRKESWALLEPHRQIYTLVGRAIMAYLDGNIEEGDALRQQAIRLSWEKEDEVQVALDTLFFQEMIESRINIDKPVAFVDF